MSKGMPIHEAINVAKLQGWSWIVHMRDDDSDVRLLLHIDEKGVERPWCWDGRQFVPWVASVPLLGSDGWEAVPGV